MTRSILACALALGCTLTGCATSANTQADPAASAGGEQTAAPAIIDPVAVSPDVFSLLVESDRVRVLRATWQPGQSDQLHGHPSVVAYALTDITGELTSKDGTVKPVKIKAGSALLEGAIEGHSFKNLGTEPAQLLLVETRK